jgi:hypothetical protein
MKEEIWKSLADYDGIYEVSSHGRIRSLPRKHGKRNKSILKPVDNTRYYQYHLSKNSESKFLLAHRLVASAFIPNPENKPQVNHINGNGKDNRVENLEWATPSENGLHSYSLGLSKIVRGEKVNGAKLKEDHVLKIRELGKSSLTHGEIASMFGVQRRTVGDIINYKRWAWL